MTGSAMHRARINGHDRDRFIVKVQLPIMGADLALIYNQGRTICQTCAVTPELRGVFNPGEFKVYCWASMQGTTLQLHERAPVQSW